MYSLFSLYMEAREKSMSILWKCPRQFIHLIFDLNQLTQNLDHSRIRWIRLKKSRIWEVIKLLSKHTCSSIEDLKCTTAINILYTQF